MLRIKVYSEDYAHNPKTRLWLVNPAHISAVEFQEVHKFGDGKVITPYRAFVHVVGMVLSHNGMGSSSDPLEVRDEESLKALRALAD